MYMRDVRWGLVKCTSLELGVWLLWNWQFAGLIERSVLLFCDLSYSLNLRSWREKGWWCVGPRTRGKNSFHAGCQMRAAHEAGDTDFNWYELVTPAGGTSGLMPHQSAIKTPLSLWFSLRVTCHTGILALWCPGLANMICFIVSPRDLVIGQLELGEEDGAVLRAPAVDHGDDFVAPTHGSHQSQVLYWSLDRLKI